GAEDPKEWNWKALSHQVNTRYGLSTNDRQLKGLGKDNLGEYLLEEAGKAIDAIDLGEGKSYLEPDWGIRSICDWTRLKFQIKPTPDALAERSPEQIKDILLAHVVELYRQKETEFPVKVGMARFMAEKHAQPGVQRYDREGLYHWARMRFGGEAEFMAEEE